MNANARDARDLTVIRRAVTADILAIEAIFSRARDFMRANGNLTQWTGGYPSSDIIARDIDRGQCFVGVDERREIRFVFTLIPGEDPTYARIYDGAWIIGGAYATLHRVASDGSLRGVLERCVDFAKILHPGLSLRIDTHADNHPMLRAIARCGFRRCGTIRLEDGSPRTAFAM